MIYKADQLEVRVYPDRTEMGRQAAAWAADGLRELLHGREVIHVVFAAAPSQDEFLEALCREDLPWERIEAWHMDEYVGLAANAPQRFSAYLDSHIFGRVPFRAVHYLTDPEAYARALQACPPDAVCMGIGENGHIAFNDPHVARFDDPETVKIVDLDEVCRTQQVHDGCFPALDSVPRQAATVTIPALLQARLISCVVPGPRKAEAVRRTVRGPGETACPASILRRHPRAVLFCDKDSASLL